MEENAEKEQLGEVKWTLEDDTAREEVALLNRELEAMRPKLLELNERKFKLDAELRMMIALLPYGRENTSARESDIFTYGRENTSTRESDIFTVAKTYAKVCEDHAQLCHREQFLKWRKWSIVADHQASPLSRMLNGMESNIAAMMVMMKEVTNILKVDVEALRPDRTRSSQDPEPQDPK